jgi:hypothetical protein
MSKLTWDDTGERQYETGVDHGVLFVTENDGSYGDGVAWNGLTTVTESPSGAESNPQYADNIKYLDLLSAEEFGATVEAFTYPKQFGVCDGSAELATGVHIGQQTRRSFGLAYRTQVGNDIVGSDFGFKLHLVYGAKAAPSEKAYATVNDSPEALAFSWDLTTSPVQVPGFKPAALLTIDSTQVDAAALANLETILYGADGVESRLPLPEEVMALFSGGANVEVRLTGANAPSYDNATHVITLPSVAGVQWKINGVSAAPGAKPALTVGQTKTVTAVAQDGYVVAGDNDWTYDY